MEFRRLGISGLLVSRVSLGAFNFGGPTDASESKRIVNEALDVGINLFDTANVYQDGRSEQILGRALKHRRDDALILTKCFNRVGPGANDQGNSAYAVKRECERSLRRLGVEHIDIYSLHRHDTATPVDETLSALQDLVQAGKVRYIGTSTTPSPEELAEHEGIGSVPTWRLAEMVVRGRLSSSVPATVVEQSPYNLIEREAERGVLPICREYNIGFLAYSPLAMGYLSERFLGDAPEGARFTDWWSPGGAQWQNTQSALVSLAKLATLRGFSLPDLAHAWLASNAAVSSIIIGPRDIDQLRGAILAAATPLDDDTHSDIDAIVPPGQSLWFRTIESVLRKGDISDNKLEG